MKYDNYRILGTVSRLNSFSKPLIEAKHEMANSRLLVNGTLGNPRYMSK